MTPIPSSKIKNYHVSWKRILIWAGLFIFLALLAVALLRAQKGTISIGEQIPDFTFNTFAAEQIQSSTLSGKVILINFWASWCKPCEEEAADLQNVWLYYQPRGDVVFLGIDYVDTEPEALRYLNKFQVTYPNGPDIGTRISQAFRTRGVPETYIFNQKGKLVHVQIGPFTSSQQIRSLLDPLLSP